MQLYYRGIPYDHQPSFFQLNTETVAVRNDPVATRSPVQKVHTIPNSILILKYRGVPYLHKVGVANHYSFIE
jgi:hypothetical protein